MAAAVTLAPYRPRLSRRKLLRNGMTVLGIAFFMVIALLPVLWMVMTSIKIDSDLVDPKVIPFWFSRPLTLKH